MRHFAWCVVLFGLPLLASPPLPGEKLDSPIAAGSPYTYARLLRLISPDLAVDADDPASAMATRAIAIRELGDAGESEPQEDSELKLESAGTVASSRERALVTFAMPVGQDEPERVLAAFDLAGEPKLIDVVAIPMFPDDGGGYSRALPLGSGSEAYVFEGHHHNSSQGYDGYRIVFLSENRLEQLAEINLLSCKGCEAGDFEETLKLSTLPDPGKPYHRVVIRVNFKRTGKRPLTRGYTAEYRWDASSGKFITLSKELQQLDAFNQKNY